VYTANFFDDSVSVIDAASKSVVATIPVGAGSTGIGVAPDGSRVYTSNESAASVSVIDPATNTTVGSDIPVGTTPVAIGITPGSNRAYVANRGADRLSVVNLGTRTVIDHIGVGDGPRGVRVAGGSP
jgi:YVTN family beta-propeller protein